MVTALAIYGLFGAGLAAQGKLYGSAGRKGVYRIKFKTPAAGGINCCGSEKGWARDRRDISHCICRGIGYQSEVNGSLDSSAQRQCRIHDRLVMTEVVCL